LVASGLVEMVERMNSSAQSPTHARNGWMAGEFQPVVTLVCWNCCTPSSQMVRVWAVSSRAIRRTRHAVGARVGVYE
jgi:hypothetical protein